MTEFQSGVDLTSDPAGGAGGPFAEIPADYEIAVNAFGEPEAATVPEPQAPSERPDGQPVRLADLGINRLEDIAEVRAFQSAEHQARQRLLAQQEAQHRAEIQQLQARLQQYEQGLGQLSEQQERQRREAALERYVEEHARTPLEKEQMRLKLREQMLQEDEARRAAQWADRQASEADRRNLALHEQRYVREMGVPPQVVGTISQGVARQVRAQIQSGQLDPADAAYQFHVQRDAAIKQAAAYVQGQIRARGQAGQPQQPGRVNLLDGQGQPQQAVTPQAVARPQHTAGAQASLDEMERRAHQSGKDEDWRAYYRALGMNR